MNYRDYLKSDKWAKKRRQVKYWQGNKCVICECKSVDVHHKTYKRLGDEDVKIDLVPLCRNHHFRAHDYCIENNLDIYHGTMNYIKLNKPPIVLKWKQMTVLEREKYLGKGL